MYRRQESRLGKLEKSRMTRKTPCTKCLKNQGMIAGHSLTVAGGQNTVRETELRRAVRWLVLRRTSLNLKSFKDGDYGSAPIFRRCSESGERGCIWGFLQFPGASW